MKRDFVWLIDSPGWGGAEINFLRVLDFLSARKHLVVHSRCIDPQLSRALDSQSVETIVFTSGNRLKHLMKASLFCMRLLFHRPHSIFVVWAHHADSSRWLSVVLTAMRRRVIIVEQLVPASRSDFCKSKLTLPLKRFAASRATAVVLNGKSQVGKYSEIYGVDLKNCHVIVNSRGTVQIYQRVTQLRTELLKLRRERGIIKKDVVICVGRLSTQKNQQLLLDALLEIKRPVSVVLVGDGEISSRLEASSNSARDAGHQVIFAGLQEDVIPWLACADVFVLPSLFEGLPGALIEAMAAGLPCIASNIPGNCELVMNNYTGIDFDVTLNRADAVRVLSSAIENLLIDPVLARKLGAAGQKHVVDLYDEEVENNSWNALLNKIELDG